ncbi:MAG: TraB/GumN family protein [Saprospiraceae bacterium]
MSLLWKISRPQLSNPSYILGTMHIQPKKNPDWITAFEPYLASCESFATEFNLAEVDNNLLSEYAQIPNNQSLADFIRPKKLAKLERIFLKSAGLPLGRLLNMRPLFITNLLTEKILTDDNSVAMDSELYELAQTLGKECTGIETFAEQLAILEQIPLAYQVKSLLKIGKNIKQFRKGLKRMFSIYESEDVQKIHKIAKKGAGKMRKLMLYRRNELMADRFSEKIYKKSIFCAIGAGHLGGKQGVLRLLKQKGLIVKPVIY